MRVITLERTDAFSFLLFFFGNTSQGKAAAYAGCIANIFGAAGSTKYAILHCLK